MRTSGGDTNAKPDTHHPSSVGDTNGDKSNDKKRRRRGGRKRGEGSEEAASTSDNVRKDATKDVPRRGRTRRGGTKLDAQEIKKKREELSRQLRLAQQMESERKKRMEVEAVERAKTEAEARAEADRLARQRKLEQLYQDAQDTVSQAKYLQHETISRDISRFINGRVHTEQAQLQPQDGFDDLGLVGGLGLDSFSDSVESALPSVFQAGTHGPVGDAYRQELTNQHALKLVKFTRQPGSGRELKKIQSLRTRVRQLATERDDDALLKLISSLNLSRFESELALDIAEPVYNSPTLIARAVAVCETLHRSYAGKFTTPLFDTLYKDVTDTAAALKTHLIAGRTVHTPYNSFTPAPATTTASHVPSHVPQLPGSTTNTVSAAVRHDRQKDLELAAKLKGKLLFFFALCVRGVFTAAVHQQPAYLLLQGLAQSVSAAVKDDYPREAEIYAEVLEAVLGQFGAELVREECVNVDVYRRMIKYAWGHVAEEQDEGKQSTDNNNNNNNNNTSAKADTDDKAMNDTPAASATLDPLDPSLPAPPIAIAPLPTPVLRCLPRDPASTSIIPSPVPETKPQPLYDPAPASGTIRAILSSTTYIADPVATLTPVPAPLLVEYTLRGADNAHTMLLDTHRGLVTAVRKWERERERVVKRNRKLLQFRGALTAAQQEQERRSGDSLAVYVSACNKLGPVLNCPLVAAKEVVDEGVLVRTCISEVERATLRQFMYIDDDERIFYEELLDIRPLAPAGLIPEVKPVRPVVPNNSVVIAAMEKEKDDKRKKEKKEEKEADDSSKREKKDKKDKKDKDKPSKDSDKDKTDKKDKKDKKDRSRPRVDDEDDDADLQQVSHALSLLSTSASAPTRRLLADADMSAEDDLVDADALEEQLQASSHVAITHVSAPQAPEHDEPTHNNDHTSLSLSSAPRASASASAMSLPQADLEVTLQAMHSLATAAGVDQVATQLLPLMSSRPQSRLLKLVSALTTLRTAAIDRIPFFTRLLATFARHVPWMQQEACRIIVDEARKLIHSVPQSSLYRRLDLRIRNARLLGELVKFRLLPSASIYTLYSELASRPNPFNIYMLIALLEHCGRWLYCNSDTHHTCAIFLDAISSLARQGALAPTLTAQLLSVISSAKPSLQHARDRPVVSLLESYVRHLVFTVLPQAQRIKVAQDVTPAPSTATAASAKPPVGSKAAPARVQALKASTAVGDVVDFVANKLIALPWDLPTHIPTVSTSTTTSTTASTTASAPTLIERISSTLSLPLLPPSPVWQCVLRTFLDISSLPLHAVPLLAQLLIKLSFAVMDVAPGAVLPAEAEDDLPIAVCTGSIPPLLHIFSDWLLDDIKHGLDANLSSSRQLRAVQVDLLGQLVLMGALPTQVLFDVLYLLVTYGHFVVEQQQPASTSTSTSTSASPATRPTTVSLIDPPYDTFRVSLALRLIDVARPLLLSSVHQPRFEVFLVFLQKCLYLKRVLPIDLEYSLKALFASVVSHKHHSITIHPAMTADGTLPPSAQYTDDKPASSSSSSSLSHTHTHGQDADHPLRAPAGADTLTCRRLSSFSECEAVLGRLLHQARLSRYVATDRVLWLRYVDLCAMYDIDNTSGGGKADADADNDIVLVEDEDEEDFDDDDETRDFDTFSEVSLASHASRASRPGAAASEAGDTDYLVDEGLFAIDVDEDDEEDEDEEDFEFAGEDIDALFGSGAKGTGTGAGSEMASVSAAAPPSLMQRQHQHQHQHQSQSQPQPQPRSASNTSSSPPPALTPAPAPRAPASRAALAARYAALEESLSRADRVRADAVRARAQDDDEMMFTDIPTLSTVQGEARPEARAPQRRRVITRDGAAGRTQVQIAAADLELEHELEHLMLSEAHHYVDTGKIRNDHLNQAALFLKFNKAVLAGEADVNRERAEKNDALVFRVLTRANMSSKQKPPASATASAATDANTNSNTDSNSNTTSTSTSAPSAPPAPPAAPGVIDLSDAQASAQMLRLHVPVKAGLAMQYLTEEAQRRREDEIVKRVTKEQILLQQESYNKAYTTDHRDLDIDSIAQRGFLSVAKGGTNGSAQHHHRADRLNTEYQSSPEYLKGYGGKDRSGGLDDDISIFTKWQFSTFMKNGKAKPAKKGGK